MNINSIMNFFKLEAYLPSFLTAKYNNPATSSGSGSPVKLNFPPKNTALKAIDHRNLFKDKFKIYHRQIFGLCLEVTNNRQAAEDITIEVFAELYKELICNEMEEWDDGIEFAAYLRKLAINSLISYQQNNCPV